jgi:hypothetical protein
MFGTIESKRVVVGKTQSHLYRGAPAVRSWSKYRRTDEGWTLCGIQRKDHGEGYHQPAECTEDPSQVSCPRCVELMHPTACRLAAVPCEFCKAAAERTTSRRKAMGAASGR